MYDYILIDGGFEVLLNGAKIIHQPHYPSGLPGVPIAEADRDAEAIAMIRELSGDPAWTKPTE